MAFTAGLAEANKVAEAVARQLAREMGAKARGQHAEAVSRILECLQALCEANDQEERVRSDLEHLGYDNHGLPHQGFTAPGRMDDRNGAPAFYYAREATAYISRK
jgi:hypothetical protein